MDEITTTLAAELVQKLRQTPATERLLVGIAGSPAAGKSSFAHRLLHNIRTIDASAPAILIGLDGWHLTRASLDLFPDPELAHQRRGIHWTFDAPAYVAFIEQLRQPLLSTITAPTFSHALKDPTFDAISVDPHHRLILVEGLYTFLSIDPWSEASKLFDERWFLRVDEAEACRRLVLRHVETGICVDAEEAKRRAEGNDLPNGRFIVENMLEPTRYIDSVQDSVMAHELAS
ncbi:P-loop containing nucleoside triphosphate hydrolase protein [Mycena amicta]|nr:P-loop containing nucleoside triphosphate hydrolase protein [Mycena amicta]